MNSFIFHKRYYKAICTLPENKRLEAFNAICAYAFEGEITGLPGEMELAFMFIRETIDTETERYERKCNGEA